MDAPDSGGNGSALSGQRGRGAPGAGSIAGPDVPAAQWQAAAGRRPLTAEELASRQRYFDRKARAALSRFTRRPPADPDPG